jgi:hypothetical protein
VYSNNFGFIIESSDARSTIVAELTTALAGVAAHELAHSVGAQHHHAYGDPAIGPANYSNTGGIQNTHVMSTGITGLDEVGFQTPHTFSQWENLTLEAAGGALPGYHPTTDVALAATVLVETDSYDPFAGPDVGGTPASAKLLTLSFMPISQLNAALTLSNLNSDADVDVYKFTVTGTSRILADVWSHLAYANSFDSRIRLLDTNGTTVLADVDDTTFNGNAYNDGTFRFSKDSSLLNIVLPTAGTYFLEVSSLGNLGEGAGGNYNLIFGVAAIPEARAWLMMAVVASGVFGFVAIRRKFHEAVSAPRPELQTN